LPALEQASKTTPSPEGPGCSHSATGAANGSFDKANDFAEALRDALTKAADIEVLFGLWEQNVGTLRRLQ
jgi:hypothetical protein